MGSLYLYHRLNHVWYDAVARSLHRGQSCSTTIEETANLGSYRLNKYWHTNVHLRTQRVDIMHARGVSCRVVHRIPYSPRIRKGAITPALSHYRQLDGRLTYTSPLYRRILLYHTHLHTRQKQKSFKQSQSDTPTHMLQQQ